MLTTRSVGQKVIIIGGSEVGENFIITNGEIIALGECTCEVAYKDNGEARTCHWTFESMFALDDKEAAVTYYREKVQEGLDSIQKKLDRCRLKASAALTNFLIS